jgi:hypothetical protein
MFKPLESLKNKLFLIKTSRRLQLVTLGVGISVIVGGSVLIGGLSLKNGDTKNTESTPVSLIDSKASNSGEVAGVSTNNLTSTPSPTPVKSKRTFSPTPTATPVQNNHSGQTPSNNNISQSNPTPTPTEQPINSPSLTPTLSPTSQPTPDTRPFEVTFTPSVSGSSFSFTATASKPIKQCEWDWYNPSSGSGIGGTASGSDVTCDANAGKEGSSKYYVRVISMSDEVKEFGEKKPCTGNGCN